MKTSRLLACVAVVLLAASPAHAALTYVISGSAASSDTFTAAVTVDDTGADGVAVCVADYSVPTVGAAVLTDSNSHTWSAPFTARSSNNARIQIYMVAGGTFGASHTYTVNGGATAVYPSIAVVAFSGSNASPKGNESGGNNSNSTMTIQPGALTPSVPDAAIVACMADLGASNTITISGDGFATVHTQQDQGAGTHAGIALSYVIQSGAASAANPTFAWSASEEAAAASATFKPAAAAGSCTSRMLLLGAGC